MKLRGYAVVPKACLRDGVVTKRRYDELVLWDLKCRAASLKPFSTRHKSTPPARIYAKFEA